MTSINKFNRMQEMKRNSWQNEIESGGQSFTIEIMNEDERGKPF